MDQTVQELVRFDRFILDLKRGCLRVGDQEIDLPPKAFRVLTYLALNAGRLVPKEELLNAVWANVAVTDESLVQSIRLLRQKLGDEAHRVIKTVPRRGYLLDVAPTEPSQSVPVERAPHVRQWPRRLAAKLGPLAGYLQYPMGSRRPWAGAVGLLCVLLATAQLPGLFAHSPPPLPAATRLFTQDDAGRVAALAVTKQLPLPAFQIRDPADDVPKGFRRFVGVWVSDTGWMLSHRQLMLIITQVDRDGRAVGYTVDGPPQPKTPVQTPAGSHVFQARISGDSLSYNTEYGRRVASLTSQNRIELQMLWRDGKVGAVSLDPVWTLIEAERTVGPATSAQ
jgi:DNA-binding winged helix-turn-helix (wHTH) protein